jgi:hypothetical protein
MWKNYFVPHANIVGLDVNSKCKAFETQQINVRIDGEYNLTFLQSEFQNSVIST